MNAERGGAPQGALARNAWLSFVWACALLHGLPRARDASGLTCFVAPGLSLSSFSLGHALAAVAKHRRPPSAADAARWQALAASMLCGSSSPAALGQEWYPGSRRWLRWGVCLLLGGGWRTGDQMSRQSPGCAAPGAHARSLGRAATTSCVENDMSCKPDRMSTCVGVLVSHGNLLHAFPRCGGADRSQRLGYARESARRNAVMRPGGTMASKPEDATERCSRRFIARSTSPKP